MNPENKDLIRKEFHHLDTTYFNTAYFGPSPYSAKQKVSRALQKELNPSFFEYNTWMGIPERLRSQFAQLIGVSSNNITHQCSTSDVINVVANGYDFKDGDVVCAIDKDYPSNVLPWMLAEKHTKMEFNLLNLGDQVLPTPGWLAENLPKNCKIFNISHVTFDTGKRVDILEIGKLCQERDILFIVDATQSLGGMALTTEELEVIDVLAVSSYKWMLGPYGHSFGYFSDKALELIHHKTANWVVSPNSKAVYNLLNYTTDTLPGARKYDRGQTANMLATACLEAGLEFLNEIGLDEIQKYNHYLRDYFLEHYPAKKFDMITPKDSMGNIVCIKARDIDPITLERELKFRNVDVSVRQGNVRLSFHVFNNISQIDNLIKGLDL